MSRRVSATDRAPADNQTRGRPTVTLIPSAPWRIECACDSDPPLRSPSTSETSMMPLRIHQPRSRHRPAPSLRNARTRRPAIPADRAYSAMLTHSACPSMISGILLSSGKSSKPSYVNITSDPQRPPIIHAAIVRNLVMAVKYRPACICVATSDKPELALASGSSIQLIFVFGTGWDGRRCQQNTRSAVDRSKATTGILLPRTPRSCLSTCAIAALSGDTWLATRCGHRYLDKHAMF